jgi:hypothetical protein
VCEVMPKFYRFGPGGEQDGTLAVEISNNRDG